LVSYGVNSNNIVWRDTSAGGSTVSITGVSTTGTVNSIAVSAGAINALIGISTTATVNSLSLSITSGTLVMLTGIQTNGSVGNILVSAGAVPSLTGIVTTASTGTITLNVEAGGTTVEYVVAGDSDILEKYSTNTFDWSWMDSDSVYVAISFVASGLPTTAVITDAYITMTSKNGAVISSKIYGCDLDNCSVSQAVTFDYLTSAFVNFASPSGTGNTPDLATIIQEIIDRPGWSSGNRLSFHIDPTAESQGWGSYHTYSSGTAGQRPKLVVTYE
jgi:hypothetical protein